MAESSWQPEIRGIVDGEAVKASTANRAVNDLENRTSYLKNRLDAVRAGEALIQTEASLASDTFVGSAVYKDDDGIWKLALAEVDEDTSLAGFSLKPSAYVQGMVISKSTDTLGEVVLFGRITGIDLSNAIDGTPELGQYYLSSSERGKLTRQKPPAGLPVCFVVPGQEILVNPAPRDVLEDHVHIKVQLEASPAGVIYASDIGQPHRFHIEDADGIGWLPADHVVFNNLAPVGAKFGYNIAAHTALQRVWPLLPVDSCYVELNGVGLSVSTEPGPGVMVVVDQHGIWWMDDCYGSAPWEDPQPIYYDEGSGQIVYSDDFWTGYYGLDTYGGTCGTGVDPMRRLVLYGVRMAFKTAGSVVTQLTSASDFLSIVDADGNPASRGNLKIAYVDAFTDLVDQTGFQVVKSLSDGVRKTGPVVESLSAADSTIDVVGDLSDDGRQFGNVRIRVKDPLEDGKVVEVQIVGLVQALQQSYQDVFFFGFPADAESSIRLRLYVPGQGSVGAGTLRLRLHVFGTTTGTLPSFGMTYRRLPRPSAVLTPVNLPLADTAAAAIDLSAAGSLAPYQYIEILSDGIDVDGGDEVLITLARSDDAYAGVVGLRSIIPVITLS